MKLLVPALVLVSGCATENLVPPGAAEFEQEIDGLVALSEQPWLISHNPDGKSFIYVVGNTVREWPTGRERVIPDCPWDHGASGTSILAKWQSDGKELALVHRNQTAVIIDINTFDWKATIEGVTGVFWQSDDLFHIPRHDDREFGKSQRSIAVSSRGESVQMTPTAGFMVTAVSADGKAVLAYRVGETMPGYNMDAAFLISRDESRWMRNIFEGSLGVDFTHVDDVAWNDSNRVAAVVCNTSSSGDYGLLLLVTSKSTLTVALPDFESATQASSQPEWAGGRVYITLTGANDFGENRREETWYVAVGLTGEITKLLSDDSLCATSVAPDGSSFVYCVQVGDRWVVRRETLK